MKHSSCASGLTGLPNTHYPSFWIMRSHLLWEASSDSTLTLLGTISFNCLILEQGWGQSTLLLFLKRDYLGVIITMTVVIFLCLGAATHRARPFRQ